MQILYRKKAVLNSWKMKNDHGKIMEFQFWKLVGILRSTVAQWYSAWLYIEGLQVEPYWRYCILSLSKALYPLLSTCSTQEYPSRHDWKIFDLDIKNQNKNKLITPDCLFGKQWRPRWSATFSVNLSGSTLFVKTKTILRESNTFPFGIITSDPLLYTMDNSKFIVSNLKEESTCSHKELTLKASRKKTTSENVVCCK